MKFSSIGKQLRNLRFFTTVIAVFLVVIIGFSSGVSAGEKQKYQVPDEAKLKTILADFDQYAEKGMKEWNIPGMAVAIVQGDKIIYSKGFGVKKLGNSDPVTPNTVFQIGSTSKAFTSLLVAMLVDEGKLKWDDHVVDHLPDFMMYDPWVTREFRVKDLMAQRSGLTSYSADTLAIVGFDREHIIQSIRHIKPVSSFRSEFAYQNHLFLVAAKLVEVKTGKSWEQNVRERIFNPLGMHNSSMDMKSFINAGDVTHLHNNDNGKISAIPMDWKFFNWPYVYGPAGGINSSVLDMTRWIQFQYNNGVFNNNRLISSENLEFLHTPQTRLPKIQFHPMQYYCQAWVYREYNPYRILWHTGATSGCGTMVALIPEADIGIIILGNTISKHQASLAYYFFDRYFGHPVFDWSGEELKLAKKGEVEGQKGLPVPAVKPIPSLPVKSYSGTYVNDMFGKITITVNREVLSLTAGPSRTDINLRHYDANIFQVVSKDFGESGGFAFFEVDKDRNVTSVNFDLFNSGQKNIFKRINEK
jgi:CubicO group peptidase (beta-lactamase class C family)